MTLRDKIRKLAEAARYRDPLMKELDDWEADALKMKKAIEVEETAADAEEAGDLVDELLALLRRDDRFEDHYAAVKYLKDGFVDAAERAQKLRTQFDEAQEEVAQGLTAIINELPSD